MPRERIKAYLDEAKAEADRAGVYFNPTPGMMALGEPRDDSPDQIATPQRWKVLDGVKLCNVPWMHSPRMRQDGDGIRPNSVCCHMGAEPGLAGDLVNLFSRDDTIAEIFNSRHYWNVREGMLDGTTARGSCRHCQYFSAYQWTAAQLREIEQAALVASKNESNEFHKTQKSPTSEF